MTKAVEEEFKLTLKLETCIVDPASAAPLTAAGGQRELDESTIDFESSLVRATQPINQE